MAVKMRHLEDEEKKCNCCGKTRKQSGELYELQFGDEEKHKTVVMCNECNVKLLQKVCKANSMYNFRLKERATNKWKS